MTKKHSLSSKSVPPGKKLKISTKEYNTVRNTIKEKNKLNITTNYKTEENIEKDPHRRAKSFKDKRMLSERNIKKGKMKLTKKVDNISSPYRKDDKSEDIKSKTMSNYHTEKKEDSKKAFNISMNKSKTKDKDKLKEKENLAKTFSEADIKVKLKRVKQKSVKNDRKDKSITDLQTKSEIKTTINFF